MFDELDGPLGDVVVDGLHAFLVQRAGILDAAVGEGVDNAPGAKTLAEGRVFGVIGMLRLVFGVQVIQIAVELVETMVGRQVLILVAQVIFAKLAGGVAMGLEQFGDGRIFGCKPTFAPGKPTFVRPVRTGFWPVMKAARPAVQLCWA